MEQLQIGNISLNTSIDFIQQQELIQKYYHDKSQPSKQIKVNHDKIQPSKQIFADTYMLKKILKNVRIVDVNMK